MAVVVGTNAGFVSEAPSSDPGGSQSLGADNYSRTQLDTSPADSIRITEVGWWCDNATEAANFEVGLYAPDGDGGDPGTRLYVDATNAKGTTAGWKSVSVDWEIDANTAYWIAFQLDDTSTGTNLDSSWNESDGFGGQDGDTSLSNPYGSCNSNTFLTLAIYAVVETGASGTNFQVNVDDAFKAVSAIKVNADDAWKAVVSAKVNKDDVWKTIF